MCSAAERCGRLVNQLENPQYRAGATAPERERTVLLHDLQKLDDNLRGRADQNLALAALLCIVDGLQRICEHAHAHHLISWAALRRKERGSGNQSMRLKNESAHRELGLGLPIARNSVFLGE